MKISLEDGVRSLARYLNASEEKIRKIYAFRVDGSRVVNNSIYDAIDYVKTKIEVCKVMDNFDFILLKMDSSQRPMTSTKFELKFNGFTGNHRYSKVENQVFKKIGYEEYIAKVVETVNKLEEDERKYIYMKHLSGTKMIDDDIQEFCHFSQRYFVKLKRKAYIKLAYLLEIEVEATDNQKKKKTNH